MKTTINGIPVEVEYHVDKNDELVIQGIWSSEDIYDIVDLIPNQIKSIEEQCLLDNNENNK